MEIESIDVSWLTRKPLAVKIIRVESPSLIWVHLENGDIDFKNMMGDLQRRMKQREPYILYQPDPVEVDQIVAIKEGNKWQRGYVLNVTGQHAHVALKDWGRTVWRPFHECYELQDQFRELHWRAIPCGLTYIGPFQPTDTWPSKATAMTRNLANGRRGWISIKLPVNCSVAALVELSIDNTQGETYDLAEMLVRLGYVKRVSKITVDVFPAV